MMAGKSPDIVRKEIGSFVLGYNPVRRVTRSHRRSSLCFPVFLKLGDALLMKVSGQNRNYTRTSFKQKKLVRQHYFKSNNRR